MTQMLFYREITPLSSEVHGQWKYAPLSKFGFSAQTNSIPLVISEIPDAAREYPVVFVKTGENSYLVAALVGIRENENLYLNQDGGWAGRYIPAFVRRYPFVLSEVDQNTQVACFDAAATESIGPDVDGEPLFVSGKASNQMTQVLDFLKSFQTQALEASNWATRLGSKGLLEKVSADARLKNGGRYVLNDIYMVSEKQLSELSGQEIDELFRSGDLARIYAHLISLGHLGKLLDRLADL